MSAPQTIPLPADAELFSLESPAFDARPPDVRNRDLIPEHVLRVMRDVWAIPRFTERPVRAVRLRDVWVAKEGLVFDRDGALYDRTVTQHSAEEVAIAHAAVLAAIARDEPADRDGPVVLCKKRGIGNYGHWLTEMLPRAHLVQERLPGLGARVLVAAVPEPLRASMAASLERLGIGPEAWLVADDAPRRFAELILVDGLSEHGIYLSPLILECAEALGRGIAAREARSLFVTRQAMGFRRLTGEDALLLQAQDAGWAPVEPALLPLPGQIALFKGAERIAGVMGAALTNILFAPPGTRVTVFAPAGMPDTFFWFLATLRGLDYTEIRCAQTGPVGGVMPWDTDLVPDPDAWRDLIAAGRPAT